MDDHRHRYNRPPGTAPSRRICVICGQSEAAIKAARKKHRVPRGNRQPHNRRGMSGPAIDTWVEWKRQQYTTHMRGSNVGFVYMQHNGTLDYQEHNGMGCYGSVPNMIRGLLNDHPGVDYKTGKYKTIPAVADRIVAMFDRTHGAAFPAGRPSAVQREYLDWLLNRSPYRHAFITKEPAQVARAAARMNTRMSMRYLITAGTFLRLMAERPHCIYGWYHYRKWVGEDLAALLAQIYRPHWKDKRGTQYRVPPNPVMEREPDEVGAGNAGWNAGHAPFSSDLALSGLKSYLTQDMTRELTFPDLHINPDFRGRMTTWHVTRPAGTVEVYRGKSTEISDGWGGKARVYKMDLKPEEVCRKFVEDNKLEEYVNGGTEKGSNSLSRSRRGASVQAVRVAGS